MNSVGEDNQALACCEQLSGSADGRRHHKTVDGAVGPKNADAASGILVDPVHLTAGCDRQCNRVEVVIRCRRGKCDISGEHVAGADNFSNRCQIQRIVDHPHTPVDRCDSKAS